MSRSRRVSRMSSSSSTTRMRPVAMRGLLFCCRPRVRGQLDREDRAVAWIAVDVQRTTHGLDNRLGDVKSQTQPPVVAFRDRALEGPEEARDRVACNSDSRVTDAQQRPAFQ